MCDEEKRSTDNRSEMATPLPATDRLGSIDRGSNNESNIIRDREADTRGEEACPSCIRIADLRRLDKRLKGICLKHGVKQSGY